MSATVINSLSPQWKWWLVLLLADDGSISSNEKQKLCIDL